MKALRTHAAGGPETLTLDEVESPVPGPGQIRIAVKACSINFPDVLMIQDLYQFKPQRPYSPGGEVAGVVDALGEGVTNCKLGDRVIAMLGNGGLAEEVLADAARVWPLPDDASFETGASLLMTYGTNMHGLLDRGHLKAGDTLLVLGAAGGVGLAAVELGAQIGARVIAAASTDEKLALAREYGAAETINYTTEDFRERIKELTGGKGVDVVYDPVGGDLTVPAIKSLAWYGRLLVVGFAAGSIPQIPANLLLLKSASAVGVLWGNSLRADPEPHAANIADLLGWLAAGRINPEVDTIFPLEQAVEAINHVMERRAQGKVILTMTAEGENK